jgi:hypothetical protein
MLFKPDLCDKILAGEKTQTRRVKKDNELFCEGSFGIPDKVKIRGGWEGRVRSLKWEVGRTYAVPPGGGKAAAGRIKLLAIREEALQKISEEDALREGIKGHSVYSSAVRATEMIYPAFQDLDGVVGGGWVRG